jgi:hypothetical protein
MKNIYVFEGNSKNIIPRKILLPEALADCYSIHTKDDISSDSHNAMCYLCYNPEQTMLSFENVKDFNLI